MNFAMQADREVECTIQRLLESFDWKFPINFHVMYLYCTIRRCFAAVSNNYILQSFLSLWTMDLYGLCLVRVSSAVLENMNEKYKPLLLRISNKSDFLCAILLDISMFTQPSAFCQLLSLACGDLTCWLQKIHLFKTLPKLALYHNPLIPGFSWQWLSHSSKIGFDPAPTDVNLKDFH